MRSGIFGWSLPPGAANHPSAPWNQHEGPCDVCGRLEDDCICPECPNCGSIGDPHCYRNGSDCGLDRTQEQIDSLSEAEARWRAEAESENRLYESQTITEAFGFSFEKVNAMSDKIRREWCEIAYLIPHEEWWMEVELNRYWREMP